MEIALLSPKYKDISPMTMPLDEQTWIAFWISRRQAEQALAEGMPVKLFAVKGDERHTISHLMNYAEQDTALVEALKGFHGYTFEVMAKDGDKTFVIESPLKNAP